MQAPVHFKTQCHYIKFKSYNCCTYAFKFIGVDWYLVAWVGIVLSKFLDIPDELVLIGTTACLVQNSTGSNIGIKRWHILCDGYVNDENDDDKMEV